MLTIQLKNNSLGSENLPWAFVLILYIKQLLINPEKYPDNNQDRKYASGSLGY